RGVAEREIEGEVAVCELTRPAVHPRREGLHRPRYPQRKGIMTAKKQPLEVKTVSLGSGGLDILALTPQPERKEGKIVGEGPAAVPELVRLLREEAKVL